MPESTKMRKLASLAHDVRAFGEVEDAVVAQTLNCLAIEEGSRAVICADNHLGYSQPIGVAVAYREHVSVSGAGFDLGCGNQAVLTNLTAKDVEGQISAIMDEIVDQISFGMGRNNDSPVDHPVLDHIREAAFAPQRQLLDLAARQLGTVGAGNHYVDLFRDEEDRIWIGVHFGSRGFGHKTASGFLALAQGKAFDEHAPEGGMMSPPVAFPTASEMGQSYIEAMTLAGEYAYAGRNVVCTRVLEILGAKAMDEVHNHHNFCLVGDTVIPTPDGPKRMDEVRTGDIVYSVDPVRGISKTRVARSWKSGHEPVLTISTGDRELRCTASHPILTLRTIQESHPLRPWHKKGRGELQWNEAGKLRPGDVVICAKGYYEQDASRGEETARLAGAFLGDGWIRHNGYGAGLAIGMPGEAHRESYLGLCKKILPDAKWNVNGPGVVCCSRKVNLAIRELGVWERSRTAQVPSWAFRLPRSEKLALIAGYFDADGSIGSCANRGGGSFSSVSRGLALGIRELAIACGLSVGRLTRSHITTNYGSTDIYSCGLRVDAVAELPLWHERKSALKRSSLGHRTSLGLSLQKRGYIELPPGLYARRIRSIQVGMPEDVFDLSVEAKSHAFIAAGIVVHNCWLETHDGEEFWVVRKGCTPAFPGQRGFVGATMGEDAVILEGTKDAEAALSSTVHGAGRAMSRTQAAGKIRRRKSWTCSVRDCERTLDGDACPEHPEARVRKVWRTEVKSKGLIDFETVQRDLATRGIELRGGAADEAPGAYKRLDEVLAAQGATIRVLHRLTPLGVAMAGSGVFDAFRD